MSNSFYLQSYQAANRRWSQGVGDSESEWQEWAKALGKIKRVWKWSVNGMLTQLDREDPEIWYALGDAYHGGHGVERDAAQAETWLRKAAEFGHVRSMTKLGMLLSLGERKEEQVRESVDWYLRAAQLCDSRGMTYLGFAYREGLGVPVDKCEAADWFIKAHAAGCKYAAGHAGRILSSTAENHFEAVKWLRIDVENGNDSAYISLACIHEDRRSPAHDTVEAFQCWLQVAERPRGDTRISAMFYLARCCRDGVGTERNLDVAKYWLNRVLVIVPKDKFDYRHAMNLLREFDEELL